MELIARPRRLRDNPILREMTRETTITKKSLLYPLFVRDGHGIREEIPAMEGQYRYSVDCLDPLLEALCKVGVPGVLLFGIPDEKDPLGSGAWAEKGAVQRALNHIKEHYPQLCPVTDVCLCEYTSHGHCGVLKGQRVDNDETLPLLCRTALSHVRAGADMVAPSDMMDGRVGAIRRTLDENGFSHIPILSYGIKYASAFYSPFRDAAGSAPAFGDRKGYQMDYHNRREALREAALDLEEGADIIMVKPALSYLDILRELSDVSPVPTAAYSVSGEYAMIKAAAKAGLIDERAVVCETTVGIFRAGASLLITYYAPELAQWIDQGLV